MKGYIIAVLVLSVSFAVSAQDLAGGSPEGDSIQVSSPVGHIPEMGLELAPIEFEPIRMPGQNIDFDDSGIREMQRIVISEIPRYPTLRLGSLNAYPFLSSSRSRYTGLDMAGIGTRIDITEWLSADVSAYLSGAYLGTHYPKRYMNASVATTLRLKVHDRFYLLGMGEVSAREGLSPKIAPGLGGKNSLGAGVEIWITDKLGIGISHTWERYQGGWHGHYGYGPIGR